MGTITGHHCRICGAQSLDEIGDFAALARVTSDSRPFRPGGRLAACRVCGAMQKIADAVLLAELAEIYGAFSIYHQSEGAEQPIFDAAGAGQPRSARLLDFLIPRLSLGNSGKLLDFGCGNGATLAAFASRRPAWDLWGSELSERTLPLLQRIPGFAGLLTCPPEEMPGEFTLITLIHAFEHLPAPVETLRDLGGHLSRDGHIFVEVPDCARTPYDLVIADHLTHFTKASLARAGGRAGFGAVELSDSVIGKELSWIGRPGKSAADAPNEAHESGGAERATSMAACHVGWLGDQAAAARTIAASSPRFGIFGTSISATWLSVSLGESANFFFDEDPGRIGRRHLGLPILSPADIPAGSDVYVPLIPDIAGKVIGRIANPAIRLHAPPPLPGMPAGAN